MKDSKSRFTRREAIQYVGMLMGGGALISQTGMLEALADDRGTASLFDDKAVALLDEIADTILPETSTPGAKAAEVGAFMALMVNDTYYEEDQDIFVRGMKTIDEQSRAETGSEFMSATPQQRLALLTRLDQEQHDYHKNQPEDGDDNERPNHYFRMMKELALLGYFTSEIGYTQAMRYRETPGRYDPCVPYKKGEKAWARHA